MSAPARRKDFASIVAGLTSANVVLLLTGVITGPIIARVLGPDGRGELAAIIAVLALAPPLLDLGLSYWIPRERAIGAGRGEILGAALPVALSCSLIAVIAAIPIAELLGRGRDDVETFLAIGLCITPVGIALQALLGLAVGESRWRMYAWTRIACGVLPAFGVVALWLLGELTVASAAVAYIVGSLAGSLPLLTLLRGAGRLRLDWERSKIAATFGAKSWLNTVTAVANNRIDQVLMAGLVPSRQLGHYAVAVTISSITYGLGAAVSGAIYPRVAAGDAQLAARSCRITVLLVAVASAGLAILTPWIVPGAFGADFREAVPMALILLAASVPAAATSVLTAALTASNHPTAPLRAELVSLAVMVPALFLLLPRYGGNGAACVSLVTYTLRLVLMLRAAQRTLHCSWRILVVPEWDDLRWLRNRARRRVAPQ